MIHLEAQGSLDDNYRNGIIEHPICLDCIWSHSESYTSDQVEWLGDDIIEDPFELRKYEDVFSYEDDDGQPSLEKDVILNTCNEEFKHFSFGIQPNLFKENLMEEELKEIKKHVTTSNQMLDSCGRETMEMGLASMDSTNIFSPWNLIDNVFQSDTHE